MKKFICAILSLTVFLGALTCPASAAGKQENKSKAASGEPRYTADAVKGWSGAGAYEGALTLGAETFKINGKAAVIGNAVELKDGEVLSFTAYIETD